MIQVLAVAILAIGLLGYVVALVLIYRLHRWMGDRGQGWPRILFNALIVIMHALALLFFVSLLANAGLRPNRTVALAINFVVAAILSAIPWIFIASLWRWWYPSAETPHLVITPHLIEEDKPDG